MSDQNQPVAGPSNSTPSLQNDGNTLRTFVMEYLQQHGFDRALQMLKLPDHPNGNDAEGEDEPMNGTGDPISSGQRRPSAGASAREARFLAPGPVPIDANLKRNIPQAMMGSASTMSDKITPEFEAQAMYIIETMQKRAQDAAAVDEALPDAPESLLDTSDRVEGYTRYRRWVDGGLDLWKVSRNERMPVDV